MGGNLFKKAERIPRKEYEKLVKYIIDNTKHIFKNLCDTIQPKWKHDMGDIDMLYTGFTEEFKDQKNKHIWKIVNEMLPYTEIHYNCPMISILYKDKYQIDFKQADNIQFQHLFHSYGGIFNVFGPYFRENGMKFSSKGIFAVVGSNYLLITKDADELLDILQLDKDVFFRNFDTKLDLFTFILKSPYLYVSKNILKKNNKYGRPLFKDFFKFLLNCPRYTSKIIDKETILRKYNKLEKYNSIKTELENNKIIKQNFNGNQVSKVTGLENKELGNFMSYMRKDANFKTVFLNENVALCNKYINNMYKKYKI